MKPAKNLKALQISLPAISQGHRILPMVGKIGVDDVKRAFAKYKPLPLGKRVKTDLDYEGKQLLTGEVVEE